MHSPAIAVFLFRVGLSGITLKQEAQTSMTDNQHHTPHGLPDSQTTGDFAPSIEQESLQPVSIWRDVAGFVLMFLAIQLVVGAVLGIVFGLVDGQNGVEKRAIGGPWFLHATALMAGVGTLVWIIRVVRQPQHQELAASFLRPNRYLLELVLFTILGFSVALTLQAGINYVLTDLLGLLPVVDTNPLRNLPEGGPTPGFVALMVVNIVLLAPIFEELLFRGLILNKLKERYSATMAIVISSALFAAIHFDPKVFPVLFTLGAVAGYSVHRTGSIMPAIGIHMLNNLFAISLTLFAAGASS